MRHIEQFHESGPTRLRRRTTLLMALLGFVAAVGVALVAPPLSAGATGSTLYVAIGGNNAGANSCAVVTSPCATIGYALTQGASGDTISVGAGTFVEHQLFLTYPVSIEGAGAGNTTVDVTATSNAGAGSATVTWTPPSDNGSPITGYTVTAGPGGQTATVGGSAVSGTITGLTGGQSYTFTVNALNAQGTSPPSAASNAVVPGADVPGVPVVVAASSGEKAAQVSWGVPSSDGAIISYSVTPLDQSTGESGQTGVVNAPNTSIVFNALNGGDSYTFSVTASNGGGGGCARRLQCCRAGQRCAGRHRVIGHDSAAIGRCYGTDSDHAGQFARFESTERDGERARSAGVDQFVDSVDLHLESLSRCRRR